MVPLPVLQENVKVFLGEYRFEFSDIVRWGERFSLCLQGSAGSFCEFLGDCGGGMQVFCSRLWEDSYHKESVPLLVFNSTHLEEGLVLL